MSSLRRLTLRVRCSMSGQLSLPTEKLTWTVQDFIKLKQADKLWKTKFHVLLASRDQTKSCFGAHRAAHDHCQPNLPEAKASVQVREGRILQEYEDKMRGPKLPPNHKRPIKTIFNHFRNTHARYSLCSLFE